MICPNCGNQCVDHAKFCARCGTKLTPARPVAAQPGIRPITLYLKPKNSFINYVFDVVDGNGNLIYKAQTQAQGSHYGAQICDAYGRELVGLRQGSKAALVSMLFELYQNGAVFGHVNQRIEKGRYVYDLPELGFFCDSDTYACDLQFYKNGVPAASATKKKTSATDQYTVTVNDYRDAVIVLAMLMIVQIAVMRSRRRR